MAIEPTRTNALLRIAVCGQLWIECGNVRLLERDFPARQGRRLWCYLVLEQRRTVSRDELADALWGDEAPDGWGISLNAVISRLRATLKPISERTDLEIQGSAGGYHLHLPAGAFVDFERARFGLHLAETALAQGDVPQALSEARVALEIAARGFLPGESLPWVERRRRQLQDIQIHAAECMATSELRRGEYLRAEREAESLLVIDPVNETAYRILMLTAAALGNRAGIARAMTQCRTMLRDIVDTTPSLETQQLFQKLTRETG